MSRLEAVSFDFTFTLAGLPRLADLYGDVLQRHGIELERESLREMIPAVWQELSCRVLHGEDRFAAHPRGDRGFWADFVGRVCERLEAPAPSRFAQAELFDRFAHPDAWRLYDEVTPTLQELGRRGYRLAVVSNFDSRLPSLLYGLGLAPYFETVVSSWECGIEKPHPAIFEVLLERLELPAEAVLHVGDRVRDDVEGAQGVGLQALHLDRRRGQGDLASLDQLIDRLPGPGPSGPRPGPVLG